jgi:2-polyprenyl-3-methyl-5-hydroxy-6-metoxy-1,4-benzoquinol methylase
VEEPNEVVSGGDDGAAQDPPDIDELVARLRARVEARRRDGAYPAELEEELSAHFRRILHQRREPRSLPDAQGAVHAAGQALPLQAARIPLASGLPGGEVLHKTVARVVGRQTQGILEQVQAFAQPVQAALEALAQAVSELSRTVQVDVAQSLDALYERQAAQERVLAGLGLSDRRVRPPSFQPWYSSEHFEEAFRGTREEMLARYRDLAERLVGAAPVLDVGCGRGEFLELLSEVGVDASGVDLDGEMVKAAAGRGLHVTEDDALRHLSSLENHSLGGIALIQVIEHFTAQEIVDFVALAADKVRTGGRVFVETVNPQSLYVFAHALFLDPTHIRPVHPAYLAFLFREAGFTKVDIEWRSPPPVEDVLEPAPQDSPAAALHNENVRRLNELLFAPQDYLIVAAR